MFESRVLRATFGDKRKEGTEDWRKLRSEGLAFFKFKSGVVGPSGELL